jgi:hypothetical protein
MAHSLSPNLKKALTDEVASLKAQHAATKNSVTATATDWLTVVLTFLGDVFDLLLELLL